MKNTHVILIALVMLAVGCGRPLPRDERGNPIFNSRPIGGFTLTNCSVDAYYYTITNNIADRGSALFVADNPTAEQVMRFATGTPAFFFIVHSNRVVSALVTLEQHPRENRRQRFAFRIIRDPKKPSTLVPLPHTHDIVDLRAREMMDGPWDPKADMTTKGDKAFFIFDGKTYSMLLFPTLVKDLKALIQDQQLYKEIE